MKFFNFGIKKEFKRLKVGFVFSGGGTKGFAELGALKALEEAGIKPDFIAGTSIGSVVGAALAAGKTSDDMLKIAKTIKEKEIKPGWLPFRPSHTTGLVELVKEVLGGDLVFSDLKIPFAAVAVCLNNGEEIVFESGNVSKCVAASCAYPVAYQPVEIDGRHYIDGGMLNTMPCNVAKNKKCDVIIAVDISKEATGTESTKTIDVISSALSIMGSYNVRNSYLLADVVIRPDLRKYKATKLDGWQDMYNEGYKAAKGAVSEIKILLAERLPNKERIKKELLYRKEQEMIAKQQLKAEKRKR